MQNRQSRGISEATTHFEATRVSANACTVSVKYDVALTGHKSLVTKIFEVEGFPSMWQSGVLFNAFIAASPARQAWLNAIISMRFSVHEWRLAVIDRAVHGMVAL